MENGSKLQFFFNIESAEFIRHLFSVERGQREGIKGARRGQGGINLSLPPLCPLFAPYEILLYSR